MNSFIEVIRQDLEAARLAFDEDEFESMNVYANRIMSNAIYIPEGKIICVKGFFLKDVALEYRNLKRKGDATALTTAKAVGRKYLSSLMASRKKPKSENQIWNDYLEFCNHIKEFAKDSFEKKAYTKNNIPFTHHAFMWLIQNLNEEREVLLYPNGLLLHGTVSEMGRIYKVHGGELFELFALSLITALSRYYQYLCLENTNVRGILDTEIVTQKLLPYLNNIIGILSNEDKLNTSKVDDVLWDLIKEWRKAFIRSMELPGRVVRRERRIDIPEDLKEKLTDSISKSLESQVR